MWECPLYVCVKMDIICLCSSGHYSLMWKWTLHFLWKWALHNFVWKWIRYGLCENGHYIFVKMATTFSRSNWHYVFVKLNTAPLCENGNYNIYVKMDTIFFMWQWKLYFRKWIASHLMKDNIVWLHRPTYNSVLSTLSLCLFRRVWFCIFSDLLLISKSTSSRPSRPFLRHYWLCQNTSQTNQNCLGNIRVRLFCILPTGHYIISLVWKWAPYSFCKNEHCFWGKWTLHFYAGVDTIFCMWKCEIDIILYMKLDDS
jgi:hypothetical protein